MTIKQLDEQLKKCVSDYLKKNKPAETQMEDEIVKVMEEWADTKNESLGMTPTEYLDKADTETLMRMFCEYKSGGHPNALLLEKLTRTHDASSGLIDILESGENEELRMDAFVVLVALGSVPYELCCELAFDENTPDGLRDIIVDQLKINVEKIKSTILERWNGANEINRSIIAELLSQANKDEKVFEVLSEYLSAGECTPLAISCLVNYGDLRAIQLFENMSKNCYYIDFIELRNGVEALGGELDDARDWSNDPTYKAIKENT